MSLCQYGHACVQFYLDLLSFFFLSFLISYNFDCANALRLVCTALYNDGDGERKYLPQFFKFIVANPLSVRTKVLFSVLMIFIEFEGNYVLH